MNLNGWDGRNKKEEEGEKKGGVGREGKGRSGQTLQDVEFRGIDGKKERRSWVSVGMGFRTVLSKLAFDGWSID